MAGSCTPLIVAGVSIRTLSDKRECDAWKLDQQQAVKLQLRLASHIGILTGLPTIGCAKTWLTGIYTEPGDDKGKYSYIRDGKEIIGAVVRTRKKVKPLFVSVGHRITLQDSIELVLKCCPRYRLPEPIRLAHQIASDLGK